MRNICTVAVAPLAAMTASTLLGFGISAHLLCLYLVGQGVRRWIFSPASGPDQLLLHPVSDIEKVFLTGFHLDLQI